jgi:transcriptional regulator with XRE-family HTH domain
MASAPQDHTPSTLRLILGLKLRQFRARRGFGLKDLAERSGLSVSYLSEIETGRKYPKTEKLLLLAAVLGVGYDDLVSVKVDEQLGPLGEFLSSSFFREFPLELFGIEPESLISLMTDAPTEAGALLRALAEIGRTYDVRVEHFLFAALRSYQQLVGNFFPEIEAAAEGFLDRHGWQSRRILEAAELRAVLEREHGFTIDDQTLTQHPVLSDLRSVFIRGRKPRLLINSRLRPAQLAFLYGRELGYWVLGLSQRSTASTQIKVETFGQVRNDFKAAYFSGALLLQKRLLARDLEAFFSRKRWSEMAFADLLAVWRTTPETFFYRLSQLLPGIYGLRTLFFARLSHKPDGDYKLTKMLNMSPLPIPVGIEPQEHYCRRWPGIGILAPRDGDGGGTRAAVQRSTFLDGGGDYLLLSLARPLSLSADTYASVSLGLRVDDALRQRVLFWDDPAIQRREVNTTCERCGLAGCLERAVPPTLREVDERRQAREEALAALFAAAGSS